MRKIFMHHLHDHLKSFRFLLNLLILLLFFAANGAVYTWKTLRQLAREGVGLRGREQGRGDGYALEKKYARRMEEVDAGRVRIIKEGDRQLLRQYQVAKAVNLVSPGYAFQYAVEAFLGTGAMRRQHFYAQAWQYRESLRDFLRARDAADATSPHVYFLPDYMSVKQLDPAHLPRLKEVPLALDESAATGLAPILILVLETAMAFFFALWAFNRAAIA